MDVVIQKDISLFLYGKDTYLFLYGCRTNLNSYILILNGCMKRYNTNSVCMYVVIQKDTTMFLYGCSTTVKRHKSISLWLQNKYE